MLTVGDKFPAFTLQGINSNNEFVEVGMRDDEQPMPWQVIYFYPKDFTFICPTEIFAMDKLADKGYKVLGFSGDNEYCKLNWKKTNSLIKDIKYPLVADTGLLLAEKLGIVDWNEGVSLRATFIVDNKNNVRHISVNELDTGRNVDEVIRTLEALQAGGKTGCDWQPGDALL